MVEFNKEKDANQISEFPLFSDSHITGESLGDSSPYHFLNLGSHINQPGIINESIMLRVAWFIDGRASYGVKTDYSQYHGGWTTSNSRFLLKAHGYQAYEQDKKICNRTIERLFLIPDSRFKRLQSWPNPFKKIVHT